MSAQDFLLEIGTEELPPKSLRAMGDALADNLHQGLKGLGIITGQLTAYAAPRRLAVLIQDLPEQQPEQSIEKRGPAVKAAFDAEGKPTRAAEGFARSVGVSVDDLATETTGKGDYLVYRAVEPGAQSADLLPGLIDVAVTQLPVAKRMRWGAHEFQFVRPVKWVVALHGKRVLPYALFGLKAGAETFGHRIHHPDAITLNQPREYEDALRRGYVMADFTERVETIRHGLLALAEQDERTVSLDEDLLQEVAALNEWPVVLSGQFDPAFLEVPEEALISSMQDHQKYFPVRDTQGRLTPEFYFVANLESKDPAAVVSGNERVIRPRLADAAFFWETDRRTRLSDRLPNLDKVVFQKALGSVGDKGRRLEILAGELADELGLDPRAAARAALLAKCDLVTNMVFEFEDLQGIAGYYYAQHNGEETTVATAIRDQYRPGHAGDQLPETALGRLIALVDRLDTLVGIFGIGQKPTGTRDPFALRRAALGVLRLSIEGQLDINLDSVFRKTITAYQAQGVTFRQSDDELAGDLIRYLLDRLRGYYQERQVPPGAYLGVLALEPLRPIDFEARVLAVAGFLSQPESAVLTPMNKRLGHILDRSGLQAEPVDRTELAGQIQSLQDQEQTRPDTASISSELGLLKAVDTVFDQAEHRADALDYSGLLTVLTGLAEPLDVFFTHVMVNSDNTDERTRRLAVLARIRGWFLRVADLSQLGD